MRSGLLFAALAFLSGTSLSQEPVMGSLLKDKEIKIPFYEMTEAGGWVLFLPMDFGKSAFSYNQSEAIQKLKEANVAGIDLVYSDFPVGQDFSALTKKRYESLQKILPKLFTDPSISFRKIRQTIAKTKKTAETLQHGFFIYFRPKASKEETQKEIEKLKETLKSTGIGSEHTIDDLKFPDSSVFWCGSSTVQVDTTGFLERGSFNNPLNIPKEIPRVVERWAIRDYIKSGLEPKINEKDYERWDSVFYVMVDAEACPDWSADFFLYQLADSTVSSVFNRHTWNNTLVLADVTGSMYPYTGQLLQWLKLTMTDKAKRQFIFFNDGDEKEDKFKVIGKTGGIYPVLTNSYDEVEKTILQAMKNGSGGDAPENNIEALMEAGRLCSACDSVVMIVDNWAPVKDISLLSKFSKPVKVVVCGVMGSIHKDYLRLARDTKGSLHLVEEDIYNLSEVKEGESIVIHGRTYKLVKGEFLDITRMSI